MNSDKIYTIDEIRNILHDNKKYLEEKYFVDNFILFGSYAKNEQNCDSDIDLLVNLKQPIDMFDFLDLQDYIEKLFNKRIDLGTVNSLKAYIRENVLKGAITL